MEHLQQLLARHAAEPVASRAHDRIAQVRLDVAPVPEQLADLAIGRLVGEFKVAQRLIREDHAKAKGVLGAIALMHHDFRRGEGLLHQDGEVQARRATA